MNTAKLLLLWIEIINAGFGKKSKLAQHGYLIHSATFHDRLMIKNHSVLKTVGILLTHLHTKTVNN